MTDASTGLVDESVDPAVDDDIAIDLDHAPRPASTMTRAQRERVRRARSRRYELIAAVAALVIGGVAALVTTPRHDSRPAPRRPVQAIVPAGARPHTVLVVHYDRTHRIDLAALVGVDTGGQRGSFVFVPPPTVVDVPSLDLQPIGSLLRLGDRSLLLNVIENTTGVHVDRMSVLDNDTLARVFSAAPAFAVTFPHALSVSDSSGSLTYPAGRVTGVAPSQAVRLIVDHESGGTLLHLATVQAVLEGWFGALHASPAAQREAARVRAAAPFAALAAVTEMQYDVLPVTSTDASGGERFDIREADLDRLTHADFGFARLGGAARRPRMELLNGVGAAGLTQRVARIVVPAGGYVTLTSNVAGFGERITRIVYYDPSEYETARHFARVLHAKSVVRGAIRLDSVDLTVVIGRDFLKAPR